MELSFIHQLMQKYYGLEGKLKRLVSYEDQNFLLTSKQGNRYVLKLSSPNSSIDFITVQNEALAFLSNQNSNLYPTLIPTKEGTTFFPITKHKGFNYGRLLTYLEGTFLAEVKPTYTLFFNFGIALAQLDKTLLPFRSPVLEARQTVWDAPYFSRISPYLKYIKGQRRRQLVDYYLLQFQTKVENRLPQLRKSTIHGDANNWNILVQENQITGFIDFGDMVYTQTINELAIAIAYAVTNSKKPIELAMEMLRGYHSVFPLQAIEIELLYYLIAVRLCTTVTMAAYSISMHPENDYITISESQAWDLLEQWFQIPPNTAENCFREVTGYPLRL